MPHIVIKTISGPSQQQLREASRQISAVIAKTMGKSGYTNPKTFE
jgi:phenylpyruvate tautomerase PptA (4-oxalocrotonate tautomerase family)